MGGLTAAALAAKAGKRVLVLEANYLPGGCSSSYWRKGYVFESGATTLTGLDEGQPLGWLLRELDLKLDYEPLDPAITIHLDGQAVRRFQDREKWVAESIRVFGQPEAQHKLWQRLFRLSDFVWRAALRNRRFPPTSVADVLSLLRANPPKDWLAPRWALVSTATYLRRLGMLENEPFVRFLNEQLLITAQSTAPDTPLLFAAPALCYTNYTNVNLRGGMIQLPMALLGYLGRHQGAIKLRCPVTRIEPLPGGGHRVHTATDEVFEAENVISNLPAWNLTGLLPEKESERQQRAASQLPKYWGAATMGVVHEDVFPPDQSLHHQLVLPAGQTLPETGSKSVFVSFSLADDVARSPDGHRVLAISTHAQDPARWLALSREDHAAAKYRAQEAILAVLEAQLPGFSRAHMVYHTTSTPLDWQQWTRRKDGNVGGVPQRMGRLPWQWAGATTKLPGFYRVGDTVYPGQGIPGVVLGGMLAAERLRSSEKSSAS